MGKLAQEFVKLIDESARRDQRDDVRRVGALLGLPLQRDKPFVAKQDPTEHDDILLRDAKMNADFVFGNGGQGQGGSHEARQVEGEEPWRALWSLRKDLLNAAHGHGHHQGMASFSRVLGLTLVCVLSFWATRAQAQFGCTDASNTCIVPASCGASDTCRVGEACVGGRCLADGECAECCRPDFQGGMLSLPVEGGRCVYDFPCGARLEVPRGGVPTSNSRCFSAAGDWAAGDCNGDGIANGPVRGFDPDARCAQLAVVGATRPLAVQRVAGSLVDCGFVSATPLGNGTCALAPAMGLACGEASDCFADSAGLPGRCAIQPAGGVGICLFSGAPSDRLPGEDSLGCFDGVCFDSDRSFAAGDCDEDGLANRVDPDICVDVQTVDVFFTSNDVQVQPGTEFSPTLGPLGMHPGFAFDCQRGFEHCPLLGNGAPEVVRCVGITLDTATEPHASVCTYGNLSDEDNSCVSHPTTVEACRFEGGRYAAWSAGDCDDDGRPNFEDPQVCIRDERDAGVLDAGVDDAGVDASGNADDDAGSTTDSPDTGPVTFVGAGGCSCHTQARSRSPSWLVVALMLLPWLARRKSRS